MCDVHRVACLALHVQWPGHLSPAVRQLLLARRLGAAELRAAGFNADGAAMGAVLYMYNTPAGLAMHSAASECSKHRTIHGTALTSIPHSLHPIPSYHAGHSVDPLADLQAWQVERLTGSRVRDLSLYRAALTHKSALPAELRVTKVGCKLSCWVGSWRQGACDACRAADFRPHTTRCVPALPAALACSPTSGWSSWAMPCSAWPAARCSWSAAPPATRCGGGRLLLLARLSFFSVLCCCPAAPLVSGACAGKHVPLLASVPHTSAACPPPMSTPANLAHCAQGEMTKLTSLLVSGASNARYAAFLGLDNYLVLEPRTLR